MKDFTELRKNLEKDLSGLRSAKIALLGDTATQFLVQALKGYGVEENLDFNIWEADFNQIDRQILDPSSEFYNINPEIVIIYQASHKLLVNYNKMNPDNRHEFADNQISMIEGLKSNIEARLKSKIIYYNFAEIDDSVYGNYSTKITSSFLYQLRKLNFELMQFAHDNTNFHICDISSIQNSIGRNHMFSPSIYVNTDMVFNIESLPIVAFRTTKLISALLGSVNKCLIVDLDNTMWGGVIGDDGIENIQIGSLGIGKAFTEFQRWILKLKERGVIIAVCSKNTNSVAKEPFEKHPEMIIRLDDISVFVANWENKADNIKYIQDILNIGFDSMVFLDDNPFERNIVREHLPEVIVPELPEDPALYLEYLYSLNLFETVSYSEADKERTKMYQTAAKRSIEQKNFINEEDFLQSLNMQSKIESFNEFNAPRVAQLSQRSNQFNLRTIRYNELDIKEFASSKRYESFTFSLDDKFGDNGLICVIILEKEDNQNLFIDTWFMSCRVLKRGMENFVLNSIVSFAIENNFQTIKGEYISTPKNEMVKNHYSQLGFTENGGYFYLDVNSYKSKICHIKKYKSNGEK